MGCCNSHSAKTYHPPKFIVDQYHTLSEVQHAIREAGLESSNLIFGIDFTGSNQVTVSSFIFFILHDLIFMHFQGEKTFGGKSLHDLSSKNPYMEVIEYLGQTLEDFDGFTFYI